MKKCRKRVTYVREKTFLKRLYKQFFNRCNIIQTMQQLLDKRMQYFIQRCDKIHCAHFTTTRSAKKRWKRVTYVRENVIFIIFVCIFVYFRWAGLYFVNKRRIRACDSSNIKNGYKMNIYYLNFTHCKFTSGTWSVIKVYLMFDTFSCVLW